jgi:anti-anti-sigma regulatory factor
MSMSYTIEKNPSEILVTIQEELTIADVKGLRDDLLAAVSDPRPVVVSAKDARRIDISVVQVLYAVQKAAGRMTIRDCSVGIRDYLEWAGIFIDRWAGRSSPGLMAVNGADNG